MGSNIKYLFANTNPRWLVLTACGLACCLISLGTFDGSITSFSSADLYGVRIGTDLLSGGIPVVVACAVMAAVALTVKRRLRPSMPASVGLAVVSAAGLMLLFLGNQGIVPSWAGEVGGAALTAAAIVVLALWAQAVCGAGIPRALLALALAFVLETVLDLLIENALVDVAGMVVLFVIVVASPLLLARVEGMDASVGVDDPAREPHPLAPAIPLGLSLACIFVWGFLMGRVQCMGSATDGATDGFMTFISSNAVGMSAILVAVFCLVIVNFHHAFGGMRIAVLAMLACALYFSGTFGVVSIPVGMVAMGAARMVGFIYMWMLGCHLVARAEQPEKAANSPAFAVCAGWGIFHFANTLSTKVGLLITAGSGAFLAYNIAIMTGLAGLIVVEFLPRRDAADAQAGATEGAAAQSGEDALVARCDQIAQQFGLTEREREVLVPLVRGRSASSIAAQLSMSTETARTHIRHIYQKTDIHSREELMDIVDAM